MHRFFKQRVTGFTVMEILVTMVLSGIVVLTAFQFYNIFNKMLLHKTKTMEEGKEILQFYNVLTNDATRAISLKSSVNELQMKLPENDFILYEFFDEYVVRTRNTLVDTFLVKVTDMNTEKELTTGFDKTITMELLTDKEIFPVLFEKTYPNDILLNMTVFHNK
jgi:hypothetical protein